ncbi:MAG: hypothetical protein GXC73_00005, partial [Chitinophagaceae bacterium]|nr:hypothetical protein [Chitinophagaceae bacterium]
TEAYYKLSKSIVRKMRRSNVHIDPTYSLLKTELMPSDRSLYDKQVELQKENLLLLKKQRVPVTVGCDSYNLTSKTEIEHFRLLNIYSNLELLKMWCETTPRAIFPNRKIAALKEGYEASFLVLKQNPVEHFEELYNISFRVKQGTILW